MLTHEPIPGHVQLGVSLTIPGDRCDENGELLPAPSPAECRHLFDHFSNHYLVRNGCGMVWRLEVQTRGVVHWHGILSAPPCLIYPGTSVEVAANDAIKHYWLRALRVLGKHNFLQKPRKIERIFFDLYHCDINGAEKHAANIQENGGRGAWLRYIQDHASKAKQEQIAVGYGRHWGVVGRIQFREVDPQKELVFSCGASYYRFWRAYHRLTRPVMSNAKRREKTGGKYASRPFAGRSLGWSSSRGIYGESVWFSKPETVARLLEWAEKSEDGK